MVPTSELRRAPRHDFKGEVEFLSPRACTGQGIDLTEGGIGVKVPDPFAAGEIVKLKILGGRLIVQGTVRWCEGASGQYRVGIQFEAEDLDILEIIAAARESK